MITYYYSLIYWYCKLINKYYYICLIKQQYFILPMKTYIISKNFFFFFFYSTKLIKIKNIFFCFKKFLKFKIKFFHKITSLKILINKFPYIIVKSNYAKKIILKIFSIYWKKKRRYLAFNLLLIKHVNFNFLLKIIKKILNFFKWNIFIKRGFRLSRQKLYSKKGKISQYSAFKNKLF